MWTLAWWWMLAVLPLPWLVRRFWRPQALERDGAAAEQLHLVAGSPEQHAQHLSQAGFVVADEDACTHQAKPVFCGPLSFGGFTASAWMLS